MSESIRLGRDKAMEQADKNMTGITEPTKLVSSRESERIGIIGVGCRFPGESDDVSKFWEFILNGGNSVAEIPSSRLNVDKYYDEEMATPGKMYTKHASLIDEVDMFDAEFFEISPREAKYIDPQQRILLEVVWQALEDAGLSLQELKERCVGVYVGLGSDDYASYLLSSGNMEHINAYSALGTTRSIAAGRIAYFLGVNGPVFQVDTACSSSLVALHNACEDIKSGRTEIAIVAGVNLLLSPHGFVACSQMRALSPSGKCSTFDASADGYVRGEGCGAVILMSSAEAKTYDKPVYANIKGSAINHDGRSNGLTAPSRRAQESLIRNALADAKIAAEDVGYVESHGTGTVLGDPIELGAIAAVYGKKRRDSLFVGALKSNIGHLEAASGIASVIKAAMVLKNGVIPPNLHFDNPNPHINWSKLNVCVPTQVYDIPLSTQGKCYAGVSAFGLSGTNVHIILEKADPPLINTTNKQSAYLLPVSAKSTLALQVLLDKYKQMLEHVDYHRLNSLSYSAQKARTHFSNRAVIMANSPEEPSRGNAPVFTEISRTSLLKQPKIAFLFSGQGSQYAGMGASLYEENEIFKSWIDQCDQMFYPFLKLSLKDLMWGELSNEIHKTEYTQPCLFAFEYALAKLWESLGVEPDVVLGHSIGEIVAATVSGVFSLQEAVKIVYSRGYLMSKTDSGAMVAIFSDFESVENLVRKSGLDLCVAASNSPNNTVMSGEDWAIQSLVKLCERENIRCVKLDVSKAFHSKLMGPILDKFQSVVDRMNIRAPRFSFISNRSGRLEYESIVKSEYWVQQIREPVWFMRCAETVLQQDVDMLIEIGPGSTLLSFVRSLPNSHSRNRCYLPSVKRGANEYAAFLESVGKAYMGSIDINWNALWRREKPTMCRIPAYPFEKKSYWKDVSSEPRASVCIEDEIRRVLALSESEIDQLINQHLS